MKDYRVKTRWDHGETEELTYQINRVPTDNMEQARKIVDQCWTRFYGIRVIDPEEVARNINGLLAAEHAAQAKSNLHEALLLACGDLINAREHSVPGSDRMPIACIPGLLKEALEDTWRDSETGNLDF